MSAGEKLASRGISISPRLVVLGIGLLLAAAIYQTVNFVNPPRRDVDFFGEQARLKGPWEDIPFRPEAEEKTDRKTERKTEKKTAKSTGKSTEKSTAKSTAKSTEKTLPRFDPARPDSVHCWPSVGGVIIGSHMHFVELSYLGLMNEDQPVPKAADQISEDEFCRKLRKLGGKWWVGLWDWEAANVVKSRRLLPHEAEVVYLGWPADGGVWVLRYENSQVDKMGRGRLANTLTMEERCKVIEMSGGKFFEDPEDSDIVRPYLEGFGERVKKKGLPAGDRGKKKDVVVGDRGW